MSSPNASSISSSVLSATLSISISELSSGSSLVAIIFLSIDFLVSPWFLVLVGATGITVSVGSSLVRTLNNLKSNSAVENYFAKQATEEVKTENLDFVNNYKISSTQLDEMEIENNNFVVTGKFIFGRENVENFILNNGGFLKPGITSKINFVIIGEDYGWSKIQKINDLNENKKTEIKILTEMELQEIIKKYGT